MTRNVRKAWNWATGSEARFTLPELLIVVGVVVLIAAVIFPNDGTSSGASDTNTIDAEILSVQEMLDAYHTDDSDASALDAEIQSIVQAILDAHAER